MAARWDKWVLEQGATFSKRFVIKENGTPKNLTGYTARMQIRRTKDSADAVVDMRTEAGFDGLISLGDLTGEVILNVPESFTKEIVVFGRCVYDFELVTGAVVTRLMEGVITISQEVTRT